MIEGILRVLFDDRTLSVKRMNLALLVGGYNPDGNKILTSRALLKAFIRIAKKSRAPLL